jgi:glutathione peroxidase
MKTNRTKLIIIISVLLLIGVFIIMWPFSNKPNDSNVKTAYDFSFTTLSKHEAMPLAQYKGKVLLIVNTASKCGFTKQYQGLQELYEKYKDQGLVIIGVPSNDFGGQEPGSEEEIAQFCDLNFKVSFPMTAKEQVSGKNAHPFYLWAREVLGVIAAPKWNFHKYLIDSKGQLVDYFISTTSLDSDKVNTAIKSLLN